MCRSQVRKLLHLQPHRRIGGSGLIEGITELKAHPWFADIDWKKLAARQHPVRDLHSGNIQLHFRERSVAFTRYAHIDWKKPAARRHLVRYTCLSS